MKKKKQNEQAYNHIKVLIMRVQVMANLNLTPGIKMVPLNLIVEGVLACLLTKNIRESVFLPHVYESIWVKIKLKNGRHK